MVYYKAYGTPNGEFPAGVDRAACITEVRGTPNDVKSKFQVRLCIMNPTGLFFSDWLWQGQEPGQWDWMPFQKDQQARMAPGTMNDSHTTG